MPLATGSAGALLQHLQRSAALPLESGEDTSHFRKINCIEIVALSDTMTVSADTRTALCIFDEEEHAALHTQRGKEGHSLFSLLNQTQSPMSKALLRRWLLFPSRSIAVLEARHDAVGFFIDEKRLCEALRKEVKGAKNIEKLAERLLNGSADVQTWQSLFDFACKCQVVHIQCATLDGSCKRIAIINDILQLFDVTRLQHIRQSIDSVIDWDESRLSKRLCVKAGLDPQLDEWRRVYNNLPSILNAIVAGMVDDLDQDLHPDYDLYIEYFPQVGYLQALCRKDGGATGEVSIRLGEMMGWSYQYSSEIKAYFKTKETMELDSQLGDLYSFIAGREIEIVQRLYDGMARHIRWLASCGDVIAEVDCLLSFAVVAAKNGYVRPTMSSEPILDIREGRHPLQELVVETYVPNSTAIEGGRGVGVKGDEESFNSVTIVTGANACGKSVYLKQSALIVYMAQIGSFVPAESALIGMVDKMFSRMHAVESLSTMQSSFYTDMQQVSQALQSSTRHSLILLDEMGKGTSSTDGASLFAATIKHLLRRGDQCPRTLAATHFHEVFHNDFLSPSLPFTPAHMQVFLSSQGTAEPSKSFTFLYKLRYGLELDSHASQCELLCGIPQHVVQRAAYIAQLSRNHNLAELRLRIADSLQREQQHSAMERNDDNTAAASLQRTEAIARAFVQWDLSADEAAAARHGEHSTLDPRQKLASILTIEGTL